MARQKKKEPTGDHQGPNVITTSLCLSPEHLALIRAVAFARMKNTPGGRGGGRVSVSDVVRGLIEKHEKELRREAGQYLAMFQG